MRIAFLVHQYLPGRVGGTEVYTHGLASRARAAGHEVLVVAGHEHPSGDLADYGTRERVHDGIRVVEMSHNRAAAPCVARWEYDNPLVAAAVASVLRRFEPDVVHCTHAMKLGAGVLDACAVLGFPVVASLTDFWFLCPRHTLLTHDGRLCAGPSDTDQCFRCATDLHALADIPEERAAVAERPARLLAALRGVDRVVALSRFQRELFVRHGVSDRSIVLLPHGVEPDGLLAAARPDGPLRFVFIGALAAHKGPLMAVEALARVPGLDAQLWLYGKGRAGDPYLASLEAAVARDPRVRLTGTFAPDRLGEVLAGADALVLPAQWYENDPLVVKAALHVGLPALVSRLGGLPELAGAGIPHDDVAAWAAALGAVRRRPRSPRPQPTMDGHWTKVEQVYEQLTAQVVVA